MFKRLKAVTSSHLLVASIPEGGRRARLCWSPILNDCS
uniref:Uncharacterized protein n=1 Tax=Utricularia reniformis TaxID=192314 RepID=A0A1Y0B315_9LAMI|nr:hypothetical protein AEK19_MT1590 [Utricularia reniformis]ART31773.1 hypothetical protein AEK19_MT1590 [Utricularia reniformis]